ncbi:MAG: glycosyltransferase family 2 protein [Ilumatobacteraceae bacterium]|nr:glycosyltransferase family 2 protein [Ilumatobacteraceae bacterium]
MSEARPALRAACHRRDVERDGWPTVSVVVPVRNEGPTLERAVVSILSQDYPRPFDVCLAVAPSDDDTAAVAARLAAAHDRVHVVDNPAGVTPAGLNAAISATSGSIVVRVDGHAELSDGYITRAVETMCRTGAVNVGGMQVPRPESPFEEAVASATTSWVGTGGATYRVGGAEGAVDTVYLGVFDRSAGNAVGWFDQTLIRNQDYELNIRLRRAGGDVWFDPALSVGYRPRGTWRALAEQYYEYGWWKLEVLRRYPESLRARQAAAALVVPGAAFAAVAVLRSRRLRQAGIVVGVLTVVAGRRAPRLTRTAGVLLVSQLSWSTGFLARLLRPGKRTEPALLRTPRVASCE